MDSNRLLLTGFEPFAGDPLNPAWELARRLDGERFGAWQVESVCLPCSFEGASRAVSAALETPVAAVLSLGLAAGRAALSLERVAVNLVDARIPDNDGAQPIDEPVAVEGPPAYFSRLPVKAMAQACRTEGVPAELSLTAGSFVCNQVFYLLLHRLRDQPRVPVGFLHVPLLPALLGPGDQRPALAWADQLRGLRAMLDCLARGEPELHSAGGQLH